MHYEAKKGKDGHQKTIVSILMGSKSDWETMSYTSKMLDDFDVAHECRILSAHRCPEQLTQYVSEAEARSVEVIIAGAGCAAHLAGVCAAHTLLPVLGVPIKSEALKGMDSLLSTVQMPAGIPVGTLAIGKAGATNAALFAIAILATKMPELREKLREFRKAQTAKILSESLK